MTSARTLYDKIVDRHRIASINNVQGAGETLLLYVDRTVLNEYTSPQAFSGLRQAGRTLWRPQAALGVVDHVNSTDPARRRDSADAQAQQQIAYFARNGRDFGIEMFDILHPRQGIEHVVLPDLGWVLPGLVIAAGDSHTTTYGAFGAVGFGIGTSDIEHLLATQTLVYRRLKSMRVTIDGQLSAGITAKDAVMALIRLIGADGAAGHALEFAGTAITALGVEGRMTMCNMAVECGARVALMAPDDKVFDYVAGRPRSPAPALMDLARQAWRDLPSDPGARFDRDVQLQAETIPPMVSWGTSPDQASAIGDTVPDPLDLPVDRRRDAALQHDRLTRATNLAEEVEVLHVARADPDHVDVVDHVLEVAHVHQLGRDRQADLVTDGAQDAQTLETEALERVGRGARLVGAAAEHRTTGGLDRLGRRERLLVRLNRARTGHHREVAAADLARPDGDDRVARAELARNALVLLAQRHDALDAVDGLKRQARDDRAITDDPDDGAVTTRVDVDPGTRLVDQRDDVLYLRLGGGSTHDDDELRGSGDRCSTHGAEVYGGSGFQPPLAAVRSASSSWGFSARQVPMPSRPSVSGP